MNIMIHRNQFIPRQLSSGDKFNEYIEDFYQQMVAFDQKISNYSMEEIEEVYDQIEEERQKFNHIFEIKELLVNNENEVSLT